MGKRLQKKPVRNPKKNIFWTIDRIQRFDMKSTNFTNETYQRLRKDDQNPSKAVFEAVNKDEHKHEFIDLHGCSSQEAVKIVKNALRETDDALKNKQIKPNCGPYGNHYNHIIKFICGVGKHFRKNEDKKVGILKHLVFNMCKNDLNYEAFMNEEKGNVLVRLQIEKPMFEGKDENTMKE